MLTFPEGTVAYGYGAVPDRVNRIERTAPDGTTQRLSLEYDGELLIGQTWEGPAAGRFGYRLDDAGRPVGITIDGGRENLVGRDRDGRIVLDGPVAFDRTGSGADIARVTVGDAEVRTQRDGRGRVVGRTVSAAGREIHAQAFEYDAADRLIARTERVAAGESRVEYRHDADGRLTRVAAAGRETTAEYDPNGNRTAFGRDGAVVQARYDADDRLVDLGGTTVQADADGFITGMRDGRKFEYSALGELLSATTPNGERIAYGYDGLGRRMSRTTAAGTTVYLYGDPERPRRVTAIRTPSGLERLWYDDEGALVAIERAGGQFVVASDQVGTPLAVFAVDGTMVAQFERDAWGAADGSPVAAAWTLEIGFAGGIEDSATGLVRFGQRDYDPATGRWMALDPAGLGAADWNLYAYCGNDPVGWIDRSGLRAQTPEEDAFWGKLPTTPLPDSFYRRSPTVPNGYSSASGSSSGKFGAAKSYFMNHRYWQPGGGWSSGPGRGFSICPSGGNVSSDPHDQTDVPPALYRDPMSGHVGPQNPSNDPGMPSGYGPIIKIQF